MDTAQALELVKQSETSAKRVREEGAYTTETTIETKFKLIYNKRPKITSVEEKAIDIEDTRNPDTIDDIATTIINETLMEIEKESIANQNDTQIIKKQHNMEALSLQSTEERTWTSRINTSRLRKRMRS